MAYPVQNLIEEGSEPSWVLPGDPVEKALDVMLEHDYSQLPVADELKRPLGMITSQSILEAQKNFGAGMSQLLVNDAMVPVKPADLFRPEDDLFDLLDRLRDYDSNEFFRRRAEDMMLVEDIETAVKELILAAFDDQDGKPDEERLADAIQKVTDSKQALFGKYRRALRQYMEATTGVEPEIDRRCLQESFSLIAPKRKARSFDDLSLFQYTELLLHKDNWQFFCPILNLERSAIRHLLNGVRQTRNALAQFRSEISRSQRDQLRFCSQWLERHQAAILVSWPVSVPLESEEMHVVRESQETYGADPAERDIVPTEETLGPADSKYAPLASRSALSRLNKSLTETCRFLLGGTVRGGQMIPWATFSHSNGWTSGGVLGR
jgi:CBS domain-containing protein